MAVRPVSINVGLSRVSKAVNPAEPAFVAQMQAQAKALTDSLLKIMKAFEDVSPDVMMEALQPTFDKSQIYCPVMTGELRSSGYLEVTSYRGSPRVEMGYAKGGNPRYAVYVHENVEAKHEPPTQAKFLQRAMEEDLPQMYYRLGEGYKGAIFGAFVGQATQGY